jgi:biopolymer transport protein ExbD
MASIQVSGGHGGKRPVDHDVPLVPFIDLLLCCVMFLLVTAVWNRLAAVETPLSGASDPTATPAPDRPSLSLFVSADRVVLASSVGDRVELPRDEGLATLRETLAQRRGTEPGDTEVAVIPDDGIRYDEVIEAVDAVVSSGFADVALRDR